MYNQVSLADLILRCRQRADMINTQFVTDSEITSYLNESLGELYDLIVQNAGQEFFLRRAWIEETAPANPPDASFNGYMVRDAQDGTYAVLPPDFYRLLGVEAHFGDGIPWLMRPYTFTQRFMNSPRNNSFMKGMDLRYRLGGAINTIADATDGTGVGQFGNMPVVDPVVTPEQATWVHQQRLYFTPVPPDLTEKPRMISVWYIPLPPKFIDPEPQQQIVPGFAHWDEYMVADVAARMLGKEESSAEQLLILKAQITERLLANIPDREAEFPEKVQDVLSGYQVRAYPYYFPQYWPNFWNY
jgi:hypothetical protein